VPTFRHAEYMTWPRGLALAEVYWSQKSARNWDDFTNRMEMEFQRMDADHVKYARSAFNVILLPKKVPGGGNNDFAITMTTEISGLDIYYSFDNSNPDSFYPKFTGTLAIPKDASCLKVVTYRNGQPIGRQLDVPVIDLQRRVGVREPINTGD